MSSRKIFTSESTDNGHPGDVTGRLIGNKKAIHTSGIETATRIDEASATITYIGKAPVGSDESDAVWQIMKIDETSGFVLTWANGTANFNNIWTNRASLTYA